jgi:hypothetical protein
MAMRRMKSHRAASGPLVLLLAVAVAVAHWGQSVPGARPAAAYAYEVGNLTGITRYPSSHVSWLRVVPPGAPAGAPVTVSGTGFDPDPGDNTVTFGGIAATVASATPTLSATVIARQRMQYPSEGSR